MFIGILSVLCLMIFTGRETAAVLDTDYEYVQEADTWLRLHIVPAKWQDARERCQFEGGILATPSTTALTKAMLSMMSKHKINSAGVFTGIHDLISKGDLMSLDGVPVTEIQLDWAHGEPSVNNEENCLVLNEEGEIADESCVNKRPYFCRKDNAAANFSQECHTTHEGYEYHHRTGSCYKFHPEAQAWHHAAKVCHAEGGHLVIINSNIEATVIKEIFENYPQNHLIGARYGYAWIGVWKWNDARGAWLTLFGQPLREAGFAMWDNGQPNNLYGRQTSCTIQRNGLLNDIEPETKEAFICEIAAQNP